MRVIWYSLAYSRIIKSRLYRLTVVHDDFPWDAGQRFADVRKLEDRFRNRVRGTCVVDRENKKRFQFHTISDGGMPFAYKETQSLEDLMFQRANKIKETGKPVQFFWSGGIDSTAALSILDQVLPDGQLMVQLTPTSIEENPNFYNQRIKPYDHDVYEGKNLYSVADPNRFVVVECGAADALYGSMGGDHLVGNATQLWRMRNRFGRTSRRYRFFQDFPGDKINVDNIWPFYESKGIEQWFINNIISGDIKPFNRDNAADYVNQKTALREIIRKHTGDEEYARNKIGVWSIRANEDKIGMVRAGQQPVYKVLAILEDGTLIHRDHAWQGRPFLMYLNYERFPDVKEWVKSHTL